MNKYHFQNKIIKSCILININSKLLLIYFIPDLFFKIFVSFIDFFYSFFFLFFIASFKFIFFILFFIFYILYFILGEFLLQYRNRKLLFVQARNVHLENLQTHRTQMENKDMVNNIVF